MSPFFWPTHWSAAKHVFVPVWRGPEPDNLGSERDRTVVSIPGDVLETDEDYARYRELADLRDLAYNRMKTLERALLDE